MGNRLIPRADGCCATVDTSANTPREESAEPEAEAEPESALAPARDSFEIMNQFNWDIMVDTTISAAFFCNIP